MLKEEGLDVGAIQTTKRKIKGVNSFTLLKEAKQDRIDINKIIEKTGLDENYELGKKINIVKVSYNGTGTYAITEEEKRKAEKLGIIKKRRRNAKEIVEASISSLTDIEMADREDVALKKLLENDKSNIFFK